MAERPDRAAQPAQPPQARSAQPAQPPQARSAQPAQPPQARSRQRRSWPLYAAATVAIVAAIIIVQNSQSVDVEILFAETTTPLVFALLIAFALGALTGWLLPRVRHHKD